MTNNKPKNKIEKILSEIDTHGMQISGFVKSDNKVMRAMIQELDFAHYVIYLLLLSHRNTSTDECFPTREILSKEANCSQAYIKKALKTLIDAGYLHVCPGTGRMSSRYFFPYEDFYSVESENKLRDKCNMILANQRNTIGTPEETKNKSAKTKSKKLQVTQEQPEEEPEQKTKPEQVKTPEPENNPAENKIIPENKILPEEPSEEPVELPSEEPVELEGPNPGPEEEPDDGFEF